MLIFLIYLKMIFFVVIVLVKNGNIWMSICYSIDYMGFGIVGWFWFVCYSNEIVVLFDIIKEYKNNNGLVFNMNYIYYIYRNKL